MDTDFGVSELQNSEIDEKFGVGDQVGDNSQHAETQNYRSIEGVPAYG